MNIEAVLSSIRFWDAEDSPWVMRAPPVGFEVYDSTGQPFKEAISAYITQLYNGSTSVKNLLDDLVNKGQTLNFAESSSDDAFTILKSDYDSGYIGINFELVGKTGDFNTNGTFVQSNPLLTIAHELAHLLKNYKDPSGSQEEQNSADYDYRGDAVNFQNTVAMELNLTNNIRSSYASSTLETAFAFDGNYTNGKSIEISRLGSEADDVIDLTARDVPANALIFAYAGNDIIKTSGGNDHIYAGDGNDKIYVEGGNNHIYGDGGNDIIVQSSSSGENKIFGGDGNDFIFDHSQIYHLGSFIDGGDGDDIIITHGGRVTGGAGADQFWIPLATGVDITILDAEAQDSIYWNGNQLLGGDITLLDGEYLYTPSPEFEFGWMDSNNVVYQFENHYLDGLSLIITLPGYAGRVKIMGFEYGDAGINVRHGDQDSPWLTQYYDDDGNVVHWSVDTPVSSIVEDGYISNYNYEGLFGYTNAGPLTLPTTFIA